MPPSQNSTMDHRLILLFACGFIGGGIAFIIGIPLPFLLGGIFGAASYVLIYERNSRELPKVTPWVRLVFMAIIGTMIGSRFSPDLLSLLPSFWPSTLGVILFILIAHSGNFVILRYVGGYQKLDAYFAGLPGGIVDSIALAEQAGADVRIVTVQHFIRIILVVITVPLLFLAINGSAVGSMAGETITAADYDKQDIATILVIALVGLLGGRRLRIPVAHLMAPLLLALLLSTSGLITINIPPWLQHLAQYMIGVSLGSQFSGVSRKLLIRGLGMGLLSGSFMLLLAVGFALLLLPFVPADFEVLFISFAAGGLAEMSLIALSLNFNPIVVALHHLVRIFFTIWIGNYLSKSVFKLVPKS